MTKYRVKQIVSKADSILLMLIVFYSAFRSTIFPQVIGTSDRVLVVLIPLLLACFVIHFFVADREEKVIFLKSNVIVIVYLAIRTVSLFIFGFNTYMLGSIMYETTFMLLICKWTVGDYSSIKKSCIVFIGFNLIVNILSLIIMIAPDLLYDKFFGPLWQYSYAALYMNPNTAGIMTTMALFTFIAMISTRKNIKIPSCQIIYIAIYMVFTIVMIYQYGCRSAIVGLLVTLIVCGTVKLIKCDKRKMIRIVFTVVIICNIGIVGYIAVDDSNVIHEGNILNKVSTGRYEIWNDCYHTANYYEVWGTGHGSNEQELENRNSYLKQQWVNSGQDEALFINETLGIHNGYLGILFNTGIICFILFAVIMWKKIGQMRCVEGYWYLIVIFVIIVNNFESVLIMNKFYTCFLMMIVLAMESNKGDQLTGEKNES